MNLSLLLNGKKVSFSFGIGWYWGENFSLFELQLFEKNDSMLLIFQLKVLKFIISLIAKT